jgi:hypothetical protein
LRSLNGVRFIKAGNDKLSTLVFDAISADLGLVSPEPVVAEGGDALPNEAQANCRSLAWTGRWQCADPAPPSFRSAPAEADHVQGARLDLERAAEAPAAPDSAAAALFATGRWPAPKPGRIDDFSWPQTQ